MWDDFHGFRAGAPEKILKGIQASISLQSERNAQAWKKLEWIKKHLPLTVQFLDLCFYQNPALQYIRQWAWCGACHDFIPLDVCTLYTFHSSLFPPAESILSVAGWKKEDILHLWYELIFSPYWDLSGGSCVCGRHSRMIETWQKKREELRIEQLVQEATSPAKTWRVDEYGYKILALNGA